MMKPFATFRGYRWALTLILGLVGASPLPLPAQTTLGQHVSLAGLRASANQGQFNGVASDASGNLFALLDEKDGVRVLKMDSTATNVLASAQLGAAGDVGLAMALDPAGDVYVTGTTQSGAMTATAGAAFPNAVDTTVNAFVAKWDPSLNLQFVTFGGSSRTAATAIAATSDGVFVTGLIYNSTLPVTPSAIIQAPAYQSVQNGFVERFSADGKTLVYATYLSGTLGDTSPLSIAADTADDAYIGGFTTAPGFPTVAALVPRTTDATTGFLIKLTPAADGIIFSTYIPGAGVNSLAVDPATNNLLLSGTIALGQFPVATASSPLLATPYQILLRMPLDGSSVLTSTVLAPGTQSSVAPGPGGTVWVDGTMSTPLLPLSAVTIGHVGNAYAMRISPSSAPGGTVVDLATRFGGLPVENPSYASLPLMLNAIAVDAAGSPVVAGSIAPTASSSLLATQTFDLPLTNAPTPALPSAVHDAVLPAASCANSSACTGSAAYLARVIPSAAPSLAFSVDASPTIVLRNLGSVEAAGLQVAASGFTLTGTCSSTLPSGDECTLVLGGSGPGSLTASATGAVTQVVNLPAIPAGVTPNTLVFSPHELDFGVLSAASPAQTRTITITNLGFGPQTFVSKLNGNAKSMPYTFAEAASDCPITLSNTKQLAAGASCHVTVGLSASSKPANDGIVQANWLIGSGAVLLTGFTEASSLNLSASTIDFGTQFFGGLASPRFLYLSNNSTTMVIHTPVGLPANSPFSVMDRCPAQLQPQTVCQIEFNYLSAVSTSTDSTTLALDQGTSVLVTGVTLPQPGTNGATAPPSLSVSPSTASFPAAVVVTGVSSTTQTITIGNTGSAAFALALAITGDFTEQTTCGSSLGAGATCTVLVSFAPSQPGARSGLLSVTAGSGTAPVNVTLSGTATPILPANNGTLDFGSVPLGQPTVQWYKVSQPFSTLTASTGDANYHVVLVEDIGYGHGQLPPSSFLAATTGSCTNCWLGVQFTPSTTGPLAATLALSSSTAGNAYLVQLTGNGIPLGGVVLTPATQDFGTVEVGSSSAPTLFTLTNLSGGNSPITVSPPTVTGDFSISAAASGGAACNGPLAVNASCYVEIVFGPAALGQRGGTLTIATSGGTATAALGGFGGSTPSGGAAIALSPSALSFQNVPGPSSTQQMVTVTNSGSAMVQVGSLANASSAFSPATNCATLSPSATCTITVAYVPGNALVTDTLQVPVTATVGGTPVVTNYAVSLAGAYTAEQAGLQVLPAMANFGPASANGLGSTRQFTINNLTSKTLALTITLPREFILTGPPCLALSPSGSCSFSASFLPITNGTITGTISAQAVPSDGSTVLSGLGYVQGYGNGAGSLNFTGNIKPGRLVDFGQVASGQGGQEILTVTNNSNAASNGTVTVRRVTSGWPFLSTTTCGAPLAIGQSCTITVVYTPLNQVGTGISAPPASRDGGTLTIESDAASAPDVIDLAGSASPAFVSSPVNTPPLVSFSASQSSLTFPTTAIGFASAPQGVTLVNTGTTPLHVSGLLASSDFTAAGSCASLLPGASCQLTITFEPQVSTQPAGPRIGTVEISSDSSTSLEFLTLEGTASPATLVFQPGALNFGVQIVGKTATLPVTITNSGNTAAVFNGITTTGDYAASGTCPAAGASLAPAASCTVQVAFTPTATGVRGGSLTIASSVSQFPLSAALTGTGAQSRLLVSPTTLSFGNVSVGSSVALSLTLSNTGTAAITNVVLAVTGDYAITQPCSFMTLSPGASCSVQVAFNPTANGARPGALTIASSDPTSPYNVPLTGTGINGTVSNATFTLTVDGGTASTQTVAQTHPATYTLTVTPVNGFAGTVALGCNAVTVAPYATCSMSTAAVTLAAGTAQTATVTINTLTSASLRVPILKSLNQTAMCMLAPTALLFWRFRRTLRKRPSSLFLAIVYATMMVLASGCGSSGSSNLRITPSGTYQYSVSASSTTGVPVTQKVTLNLNIP